MITYNPQTSMYQWTIPAEISPLFHPKEIPQYADIILSHDRELELQIIKARIERSFIAATWDDHSLRKMLQRNRLISIIGIVVTIITSYVFAELFHLSLHPKKDLMIFMMASVCMYFFLGYFSAQQQVPLVKTSIPLIGRNKHYRKQLENAIEVVRIREDINNRFINIL